MCIEDEFVVGLPEHACETLKQSIRNEAYAEDELAGVIAAKVESGEMTDAEAEERFTGDGYTFSQPLTDACAMRCGNGVCQLAGYGNDLLDVGWTRDYDSLSPEDKARYDMFQKVTLINMSKQMADGIFLG